MSAVTTVTIKTVRDAWHVLNGVVCLFKPADLTISRVRKGLLANICRDMRQFEPAKPRTLVRIDQVNDEDEPESYQIQCQPNLADLDLVRGPAVEPKDIRVGIINPLGSRVSGVLLAAINDGNRAMRKMIGSRPLSVYQIRCQFGVATDTHWFDGRVWEKTTYAHLTKTKLDRVLASVEASNQRKMFDHCGVDPCSQTAYELASQGLLRPAVKGPTVIYSIKCVHFEPPHYTLELHCINENMAYLSTLVHDLGIALKTTSVCHQMRCIRFGHFQLELALLRKHWTVEHLLENMAHCGQKLLSAADVTPILSSVHKKSRNAHF